MANVRGVLVKVRGDGKAFAAETTKAFGAAPIEIEPILRLPAKADEKKGLAADRGASWLRVRRPGAGSGNPWDLAHDLLTTSQQAFGAAPQAAIEAIEPDIEQGWLFKDEPERGKGFAADSREELCEFDAQDGDGGKAVGPENAWNATNSFSELAKARARVDAKLDKIFIAHLDTGYDPAHMTLPMHLRRDLQRNFVADDNRPDDASDQTPMGMDLLSNRGHGTGTLSLLAGNKLDGTSPDWPGFTDFIGAAPQAQIIPVRIANWVVRFSTSTMVQGFDYAREKGAHVLSMSMGGLSSRALVDAINLAYEAGVVMVTAGGNNIAGTPSPSSIVFPARYRRVLAACGVMADGRAYAGLKFRTMQGNYGPQSKMETAIGAYTPNVPWAQIDCAKIVDMDGAGTSAATPQVAAAAALWLAEYWDEVKKYPEPWMRVEAVRHALFKAAAKTTPKMNAAETLEKIGQGVLKASEALKIRPPAANELKKTPPAEASWSWLDVLTGTNVSLAPDQPLSPQQRAMLELELTQIAQRVAAVDEIATELEDGKFSKAKKEEMQRRYFEAVLEKGAPSAPLCDFLERTLNRPSSSRRRMPKKTIPFRKKDKPQPERRLRVYALDPSIAKSLASESINETILSVRWDGTREEPLKPGPVGEYLEVIDVDPASNKVYEPVDLMDTTLLAQDGWAPSEGNPQFHQQMVYAVAMTTIRHFEQALGRKALWAPRQMYTTDKKGERKFRSIEVPRLRLYPHALRTANAYYSPEKKALLFGYFPADSQDADTTAPGSMVFTCLSTDIIAHEMSHALLDGLHRRFQEASNPDVPAFHEAFADIVALFQHFTVRELVRFEIARARGDLSAEGLLSGLARQFGEGSSRGGPLRNYRDKRIAELKYLDTTESHERGSILVFAVYDAFVNIVTRRTEDLIRIAAAGDRDLSGRALHTDLVERMTDETCKTAKHVLQMCIRALDYCPAADITFGEYLRALITADVDLVTKDRFCYRVAFMEAFRKRGILPTDIRTISAESLTWDAPDEPSPPWLETLVKAIEIHWNRDAARSTIFYLNEKNRKSVWQALRGMLGQKDGPPFSAFGLVPDLPRYDERGVKDKDAPPGGTTFEVHSVRPARRIGPDGNSRNEVIAVIQQRRPVPLDGKDMSNGWFWFRGGTTLILDTTENRLKIRYSIVKNMDSATRLDRQRKTAKVNFMSPLRSLYFGKDDAEPFAMMHAFERHHENGW